MAEKYKFPPNIFSVLVQSGKGGVGKTTISAALGLAIATLHNKKTLIIDTDISGASIANVLGIETKEVISKGGYIQPVQYSNTLYVMSMANIVTDPNLNFFWKGEKLSALVSQLLTCTNLNGFEFVIIDSPPGTSDTLWTLLYDFRLDTAVVVSEPNDNAIKITRKGLIALKETRMPVLALVINKLQPSMNVPVQITEIVKEFGIKNLFIVPFVADVFVTSSPKPVAGLESISKLAQCVVSERERGTFSRMIIDKVKGV
jgi:Mrp family chromosome partitioning ATPase